MRNAMMVIILTMFTLVLGNAAFCSKNPDVPIIFGKKLSDASIAALKTEWSTMTGKVQRRLDMAVSKSFEMDTQVLVDFGWKPFRVVTVKTQNTFEGNTWIGKPLNAEPGDVIVFTVVDGQVACTAKVGGRSVSCRPSGEKGIAYVVETTNAIRPGFFPSFFESPLVAPEIAPRSEVEAFGRLLPQEPLQSTAGVPVTVNVLALYTPGLKRAYEGASGLRATLQNLFDYANVIYSNSNTNVTLRMCDLREIATDDDADMDSILEDMYYASNELSDLLSLMNQTGADIAVLFRKYSFLDFYCGRAYMPSDQSFLTEACYGEKIFKAIVEVGEYQVGSTTFYCPDDTLTHEIGHNFGCDHARTHNSGGGIYSFSYGYCDPHYGTVISYCEPTVMYFSDNRTVDDEVPGDADTKNTETIRRTAASVVAARDSQEDGNDGTTYNEYQIRLDEVYVAYYGRPANPAGLDYWADRLERGGGNLRTIIDASFGTSDEFIRRYGYLTNEKLIDTIYLQTFNRYPDSAVKSFYFNMLTRGLMSLQTITLNVLDGAMGVDAAIVANKVGVAVYFMEWMKRGCVYDSEVRRVYFTS